MNLTNEELEKLRDHIKDLADSIQRQYLNCSSSPESSVWEITFKKMGYADQGFHTLTINIHSLNILTAMEAAEKYALEHYHQFLKVHIHSVKHILYTHN